ncbi:MAG: signal peptidase II [Clostridia bacterium]|nr:signal peptidase II [Clostridia bacterium]
MNRFLSFLRERWLPLAIMAAAVVLDIITKQLAVAYLKPIDTFPIIQDVFHLTYRINPGAAWSLFSAPDQRWIFMSVSTVAILAMLAYLFLVKIDSKLMKIGLGAIIGGGIGNMIDRISLGYVVDFLDARIINFPVFNIADCFVTIGAGMLMLALILDWRREAKGGAREDNAADN